MQLFRRPGLGGLVIVLSLALAACSTPRRAKFEPEGFGSTTTHSRGYEAGSGVTCEAARRALLSQGFLISLATADHVNGRKNFQPDAEVHVQIDFHVVCAPDGASGRKTIAFVNALQDRYALKKSNNSASLGVGAIGSLSLPFSSSDDSLVKVASETITSSGFYERFFALLQRYLSAEASSAPPAPTLIAPPAAEALPVPSSNATTVR